MSLLLDIIIDVEDALQLSPHSGGLCRRHITHEVLILGARHCRGRRLSEIPTLRGAGPSSTTEVHGDSPSYCRSLTYERCWIDFQSALDKPSARVLIIRTSDLERLRVVLESQALFGLAKNLTSHQTRTVVRSSARTK